MTIITRCFSRIVFVFLLVAASIVVHAHIKNEGSQFPDIEFSDARFEIVLLVGAGIIPETPVFEPDIPLSRSELAAWAALSAGLAEGGETPDLRKLSDAALEAGIIDSLQGDASYSDINNVLFEGVLNPVAPAEVPSKADAATFIAENLATDINGQTLLDRRGMSVGPEGVVSMVESRMNPDGGSSYYISIGDATYPMYSHGRVANGPTDLIQWEGRTVRRSFLKTLGDLTLWIYLEAEPVQAAVTGAASISAVDNTTEQEPEVATSHTLLYGLVAAVLVLGVILFFRTKRS